MAPRYAVRKKEEEVAGKRGAAGEREEEEAKEEEGGCRGKRRGKALFLSRMKTDRQTEKICERVTGENITSLCFESMFAGFAYCGLLAKDYEASGLRSRKERGNCHADLDTLWTPYPHKETGLVSTEKISH